MVDSLDSGSSVHCGRAGSSPASRTKKITDTQTGIRYFFVRWRGLEWCKCNADERCRQRLDAGEPLFLPQRAKMQTSPARADTNAPVFPTKTEAQGYFLSFEGSLSPFVTVYICLGRPGRRLGDKPKTDSRFSQSIDGNPSTAHIIDSRCDTSTESHR